MTWTVNGVAGGDASVGTLTPVERDTAPRTMPEQATVILTARSVANPSVSQSMMVTLAALAETTMAPMASAATAGAANGRDDDRADDAEPGRIGGLRGRSSPAHEPERNMERKPVDRARVDLAAACTRRLPGALGPTR